MLTASAAIAYKKCSEVYSKCSDRFSVRALLLQSLTELLLYTIYIYIYILNEGKLLLQCNFFCF